MIRKPKAVSMSMWSSKGKKRYKVKEKKLGLQKYFLQTNNIQNLMDLKEDLLKK